MKDVEAIEVRVIKNIRRDIENQKSDIWVRRAQLEIAKKEFERLQEEGEITSFRERTEWGCNGSANFWVEYPT